MDGYKIKKRDGRIVDFNPTKITIAIQKAMDSVGQSDLTLAEKITRNVKKELKKIYFIKGSIPTVENIQDLVERTLILAKLPEVAKSYILYRDLHSRMRNICNFIDTGEELRKYINKKSWKINADDQIDYSLQGMYKSIINTVSENFWMNEVYTKEMRNLHERGDLKIHKSSCLSAYCVGWDIEDLLMVGFQGVSANVTSAPAKHFSSVLGQIVNFLFILTQETPDGAVALSSFDTYLAPFVYYDQLDYKKVKQGIQEFVYNMNVPTKVGAQAVFSNITLDLECPKHLKNQPAIIGGKHKDKCYGEFQKEMDMINRALSEVYAEGDAKGRAFTWPIPTYNLTKDFNWDNKNLDPLWEMTAKYGIPYFANFINSDMDPSDVRSMCCRLRIDNRELHRRGGGFFGANPLTGSIGYVTINLPRLGYLYKGNKGEYLKNLLRLIDVSHEILERRRNFVEEMTERGLYPYSKFYLRRIKEKTGKYWTNHFNTVGVIGMNESCLNFMGKDISSTEGKSFAIEIMDFINKRLVEIQQKTGTLYNLEATPGESTSFELALKDKKYYPDIIVANEEEYKKGSQPYYTNSTHLAVGFTDDIFEALDIQDELQCKYTGGTVFHGFLGERLSDGAAAKQLVKKIATKYKLPYFTLTPTFSICDSHGYLSGEIFNCPKCGGECKVYSRVVGKISPVQRWNIGKQSEFKDRKEYKGNQ